MNIKKKNIIGALGLSVTIISSSVIDAKSIDIENHWAKESIIKLEDANILRGYEDNTFKPDKSITREEVCSAINAYIGGEKNLKANFPDVSGRWSEAAIASLANKKLINGYPDGTFKPENEMTREEFANILFKYLSSKHDFSKIKSKDFSDIESSYAKEAISKLAGIGIIKGYEDGSFGLKKQITRAELAKIIDASMEFEKSNKANKTKEETKKKNDNKKENNTYNNNYFSGSRRHESSHTWPSQIENKKDYKFDQNTRLVDNRIVFKKVPQADDNIFDLELDPKFTTAQVEIAGSWQTKDKKFKANEKYTIVLKLSPKKGYSIKDLPEDFFSVANVESAKFNKEKSELSLVFFVGRSTVADDFQIEVKKDNTIQINRYIGNKKNIVIPKSINGKDVTSLGWGCFQDMRDIESISFEKGIKLTELADHAFANCISLKNSISLPEGIATIGEKAFNGCKNLEEINLPASLTTMKWDVIRECENLKKLSFAGEKAPTKFSKRTFADMSTKTIIEIPEKASIDEYRKALRKGGLPDSVEIIKKGQTAKKEDIVYKENPDGSLSLIAYNKEDKDVLIKNEHNGKKVTIIAENAFKGNKTMESLVIEDGITKIGNRAFISCEKLSKVSLPSSIKEIETFAFSSCPDLNEFEFLGQELPKFGKSAMNISSMRKNQKAKVIINDKSDLHSAGLSLQKAELDPMIEVIKKSDKSSNLRWIFLENGVAFHRCLNEDIESIKIDAEYAGKPVTELGESCFIKSRNLSEVKLPNSLVKIGREAFSSKKNLKEISIPASVKEIGFKAFEACSYYDKAADIGIKIIFNSKENVKFVDRKRELGPGWTEVLEDLNVFKGINKKSQIIINCDISKEELAAFKDNLVKNGGLDPDIQVIAANSKQEDNNKKEDEQKLEDDNFVYETNSDGSLKLVKAKNAGKNLVIKSQFNGKKVTEIANEAFKDNKDIESLVIEDGIEKIGNSAFKACDSIKKIQFPASIKEFGKNAFNGISVIESIEFLGESLPILGKDSIRITHGINREIILNDNVDLHAWGYALQKAGVETVVEIRKKSDKPSPFRWEFKENSVTFRTYTDHEATKISLPNEVGGKLVTELDEFAFINQSNLSEIKLPDGLVKIGREAFYNKPFLKEVSLPASLKEIGYQAFEDCSFYDKATDTGIKIIFNSKTPVAFVDYKTDEYDYNGNGDISEKELPNALANLNSKSIIVLNFDASMAEMIAFKDNLIKNGGLDPNIKVITKDGQEVKASNTSEISAPEESKNIKEQTDIPQVGKDNIERIESKNIIKAN